MSGHTRIRPIPKRGWTDRYRYVVDGAVELLVFGGFVATVLFVLFFATWTGR